MRLEILTPEKMLYEGQVSVVTLPGSMGTFQVLKGHAPIVSILERGNIVFNTNQGVQTLFIKRGVVDVKNNLITILAEN